MVLLGEFFFQNRLVAVRILEDIQVDHHGRRERVPFVPLSKVEQGELVQRFASAFEQSDWITQMCKDETYNMLIYEVELEDPYRPYMTFALAHFMNEHFKHIGTGRAYKTHGAPQPSFVPTPPPERLMTPPENEPLRLSETDETEEE